MTPVECQFEAEVLAAVLEGRWPERSDPGLILHAAACPICADVAAIASAMDDSRAAIPAPADLPNSGLVWWMAQRRARLEAAQAANRPLNASYAIALVCAVVMLWVYFGPVAGRFQAALDRVPWFAGGWDIGVRLMAAARLLSEHAVLACAMAAVLLLIPAAAYFAIGRE